MISIYYINKNPRNNRNTESHGTFRNAERTRTQVELGQTDDEAASAIHRTFAHALTTTHKNSFMLI